MNMSDGFAGESVERPFNTLLTVSISIRRQFNEETQLMVLTIALGLFAAAAGAKMNAQKAMPEGNMAQAKSNEKQMKETHMAGGTVSPVPAKTDVVSHTRLIKGLNVFYREAGDPSAPKLVLLGGFPASSRQFRLLMPELATRSHVISMDYPGFGNTDMPDLDKFSYTFDNLSESRRSAPGGLGIHQVRRVAHPSVLRVRFLTLLC